MAGRGSVVRGLFLLQTQQNIGRARHLKISRDCIILELLGIGT